MNKYLNQYRIEGDISYIDCFDVKGNLRGTIIVDSQKLPMVQKYQWHIENSRKNLQYAQTTYKELDRFKSIRIHRLLMPDAIQIDHINHNGLDNRMCNLRSCNNRENNCNKDFSKNPSISGHTGIRFNSKVGSYYVRIMVNKKEISLGHYNSLDAAINARKQGELKYFGKFRYQK